MRPAILLLPALFACQPQLVAPDEGGGVQGRSLFAEDSPAARALAEELATAHATSPASRLEGALPGGLADTVPRGVRIARGLAHVRLGQSHDGVPVFGAQAIVHLDGSGAVRGLTDRWQRGLQVDTRPGLSRDGAIARVEAEVGAALGPVEAELFVLRHRQRDHLVWRVVVPRLDGTARSSLPVRFVDAHTGEVVRGHDGLQTAGGTVHATTPYHGDIAVPVELVDGVWHLRSTDDGIGTYDGMNHGIVPGWISGADFTDVTSPTLEGFTDVAALDAQHGANQVMAYLAAVHGRDGIDGAGGPHLTDGVITSVVHWGTGYPNAFWNGITLAYGDGDGWTSSAWTSVDIAAHEMTHGLTQYTAGLVYDGESGAVNESMSDIFGALVEQWAMGDGPDRWKVGEVFWTPHYPGDALRDMTDPTVDWQSKDHYDTRYTGLADNGGVHWNSGIGNLAFHLLVEGGRHPKDSRHVVDVVGIGWDRGGAIAYAALTEHMTPETDLHGMREAFLAAAVDLYGEGGEEAIAVADAFAEVGLGDPASAPGVEPPPPPADGAVVGLLDLDGLSHGSAGARASFEVPEGVATLTVRISGGTGDADLYVRAGAAPEASLWDCRPYQTGSDEVCTFDAPAAGPWHVWLNGYPTFEGARVQAEAVLAEAPGAEVLVDRTVAGVPGSSVLVDFEVPVGAPSLTVTLSGGTGDADLYVGAGTGLSTSDWDCRPFRGGNEETCTFPSPAPGPWQAMAHGILTFDGVQLTATVP